MAAETKWYESCTTLYFNISEERSDPASDVEWGVPGTKA
jgi:hypothetical protein